MSARLGDQILADEALAAECARLRLAVGQLRGEAARYRRRMRVAETRDAAGRELLEASLRQTLRVALGDRIADPAVFERFVDIESVLDRRGLVDLRLLELRLRDVLHRHPYLSARIDLATAVVSPGSGRIEATREDDGQVPPPRSAAPGGQVDSTLLEENRG